MPLGHHRGAVRGVGKEGGAKLSLRKREMGGSRFSASPAEQKAQWLLSLLCLPWAKLLEGPKALSPLPSLPGNEASGPQQEVTPGRRGRDGTGSPTAEASGWTWEKRRAPLSGVLLRQEAPMKEPFRLTLCPLLGRAPCPGTLSALTQSPPAASREEGLPLPPRKPSPRGLSPQGPPRAPSILGVACALHAAAALVAVLAPGWEQAGPSHILCLLV